MRITIRGMLGTLAQVHQLTNARQFGECTLSVYGRPVSDTRRTGFVC